MINSFLNVFYCIFRQPTWDDIAILEVAEGCWEMNYFPKLLQYVIIIHLCKQLVHLGISIPNH